MPQAALKSVRRARNRRAKTLTVGELLDYVMPSSSRNAALLWPPDAFAAAATVLQRSAGYLSVIDEWPPNRRKTWNATMRAAGAQWRAAAGRQTAAAIPARVREWWRELTHPSVRELPIDELRSQNQSAVCAALQILAAADEACKGVGRPGGPADAFDARSFDYIGDGRTLCSKVVDASRAIVLPKLHTPQLGITLRSLTHNLALYLPGEVTPRWHWHPFPTVDAAGGWALRLLLLPWPKQVRSEWFNPSAGRLGNMPPRFGFFHCDVRQGEEIDLADVKRVFLKAAEKVGHVDGIVLPELALKPYEAEMIAEETGAFVIAGCGVAPRDGKAGENLALMAVPMAGFIATTAIQSKHHRWKLEKNQIQQYRLGNRLDPARHWWEHIAIESRELNFVTFTNWLTISFLICEDLARLDPVTHLLHAIGPNLIIALLMDGPQLTTRWPARYATVLADDPGSSVLTLTSLGMATASRAEGKSTSRVVALWKDAMSATREIELQDGCDGIVLSLRRHMVEEWSADGRSEGEVTSYLVLDDHEPV